MSPHRDPDRDQGPMELSETETVAVVIETPVAVDGQGDGSGLAQGTDAALLNRHQRVLLAELTRLHHSLRGPQSLLEAAGHFNRPFPPRRDFYR